VDLNSKTFPGGRIGCVHPYAQLFACHPLHHKTSRGNPCGCRKWGGNPAGEDMNLAGTRLALWHLHHQGCSRGVRPFARNGCIQAGAPPCTLRKKPEIIASKRLVWYLLSGCVRLMGRCMKGRDPMTPTSDSPVK
jgi:hypothetical protein